MLNYSDMNQVKTPPISLRVKLQKINKPMASLKLAVFVILGLAVLTSIGTFVEARYDATAAKKLVYHTWWMYSLMILLAINLSAVMFDRWPWKKRHASFVSAHIGILLLLAGSLQTFWFGLDGTMRIGIGESNGLVQVPETDVVVYSSFDGDRYSKTLDKEVDFFSKPPSADAPFTIPTNSGPMQIIDYKKYVVPTQKVQAAISGSWGAGVRLQIKSQFFDEVQWIVQKRKGIRETRNFGPAKAHIGKAPEEGLAANEFYLEPLPDGKIRYTVFHNESLQPQKTGIIKEGEAFQTGWMDAEVRILRFFPQAEEVWDIQPIDRPTPLSTAAVKIVFQDREHWLLMNDMVKFFTEDAVYLVTYANRRIDLGFKVQLQDFEVTRYQGTMRAMAYKSVIDVPPHKKDAVGLKDYVISMNEPLQYNGKFFYQASFQEENGAPVASILSVNDDPGRFLKYLGSLVISIGILLLFYFKNLDFRMQKKKAQEA